MLEVRGVPKENGTSTWKYIGMDRQLSAAWGQFLSRFEWDWFVTLTFRNPVVPFRAHKQFGKFANEIEKAVGIPIAWFRGDEYGQHGGNFHLHALMLNVAHL